MNKLLQVELKKIFRKKSIYIIWGLMLIFCLLNNILYYTDYDEEGNYKYLKQEDLTKELEELSNELTKYNKDDITEATMYITINTKINILEIKQTFPSDSWQYKKIDNYLYDTIYQINYYKYIEKNDEVLKEYQEDYNIVLEKLNSNDYLYFLNLEIENNIDNKKYLEEIYQKEKDKKNKQEIKIQLEEIDLTLKILNYRMKNDIKEDNSYLNIALENYQENYKTIKYYDNLNKEKTYQEKLIYQEALSSASISKYIMEHHQNINKQNNLNYQLRTIIEDYEIFIVMLILIICSTIICDEFKDGTIKLLLIKPYSRGKILLSKYFTSIIVIIITILLLIAMQLVVGGTIFGFDSLNIPVVIYDFNNSKIIEYSIFQYMMIRICTKVPFLLILIAISFLLGVATSSIIISITFPLILYMFSSTLIYLAKQYDLEFMKYLVNINWNLQEYLFGKLPEIPFISFNFSCLVLSIYFLIFVILTFIIFKRKNIKNI